LTVGWLAVGGGMVAAAVSMLGSRWAPVIDNALIAAMTVDSLSLDPPLVGVPTSLGLEDGVPLSHAGPLGLWSLSLPTVALGEPGEGLVIGSVLLSLVWLGVVAALLRRRRDVGLEALGLGLFGAMVISLGGGILASPFNPHLGILPLLVALLATWGVLAGRHRHLWVLVIAGSFAGQTHLGYLPLVGAMVVLASAGIGIDLRRGSPARRRRLTHRVIPVGVVLGGLAWAGPVLDQLFGDQNLSRLLTSQSGDRTTAGLGHGLDVAVEMTSMPPHWLLGRAGDEDLSDPGALRVALSVAMVGAVVALLVWAFRRRHRDAAALSAVALAAVAMATLSSARVVDVQTGAFFEPQHAVLYRLFWWPVGATFALGAAYGALCVARSLRTEWASRTDRTRWAPVGLVGAAATSAVVALGVTVNHEDPAAGLGGYFNREVPNAEAIAELPGSPDTVVLRLTPEGTGPEQVRSSAADEDRPLDVWDLGPNGRYGYAVNLVAQLRLRGIEVRFADEPDDGITFMRAYRDEHPARGDESTVVLHLVGPDVHADPPDGYRRISTTGAGPGEQSDAFNIATGVFVRTG
jgi:hypothetical protein